MPQVTRTRSPFSHTLELPPPYTLVTLRERGDAFSHAASIAAESGAGTLVYVGRFDLAEFAVVLEPEEPLRVARRAMYIGMTALRAALVAHAPPEMPVTIDWPGAILINGGLVGGGRLAWPDDTGEEDVPDWLVFGAMIRTASTADEPGRHPLATALELEGFDDAGAATITESFARHLMMAVSTWQEEGFDEVAREYLEALPGEKGLRHRIDENGDLLLRRNGKTDVERRKLIPALQTTAWLDTSMGAPRL